MSVECLNKYIDIFFSIKLNPQWKEYSYEFQKP